MIYSSIRRTPKEKKKTISCESSEYSELSGDGSGDLYNQSQPTRLENKEVQFNFGRIKCTVLGVYVITTKGEKVMLSSQLSLLFPIESCLFTFYPRKAGFRRFTHLK